MAAQTFNQAPFTRLSVVMPNYNYDRFIARSIESALAIDWPQVEVIVVDDGSTDSSVRVVKGFGDKIRLIQQANSGPREACNRGFAASDGDAVLFLDSDDMVDATVARRAAAVWGRAVSKVQFQMRRVDGDDRPFGRPFPNFGDSPSPRQFRTWMTQTGEYPTPPGSGNIYSRSFLNQIFPLDDRCGDATDSAALASAPYLGDVITVDEPLVHYRVHGDNRSSLRSDSSRFAKQIERALRRQEFALEVSGQEHTGLDAAVRTLRRGRHLLQMRVAQYRVAEAPPAMPGDTLARLVLDSVRTLWAPGPAGPFLRLAVAMWCLVTLVVPRKVARRLVYLRFR